MKLTVIIPSYNSDRLLLMGLELLMKQRMNDGDCCEVIVVDDGSDDMTRQYVEQLQVQFAELRYVYRPRDHASCRSRARNLGIQASTGDVLIFLDSGILVPLDGLARIADHYRNSPMSRQVLMHYMYGLKVDPAQTDIAILDGLSFESADGYVPLLTGEEWQDFRHDMFRRDVSAVASPWYYGFSCAITVPAALAKEVGGFDEAYTGWGVEDVDFSYRLYQRGATFHHPKGLIAFHYPHQIHRSEEKWLNESRNKAYMHAKFNELESELYLFYEGPFYTFVMEKLSVLQMVEVLPAPYAEAELTELAHKHLAGADKSLLIAPDCVRTAELLPTTHLFAYTLPLVEMYKRHCSDRSVNYLLGCRTAYEDDYFDVVIITDLFRLFSGVLQEKWLLELSRIAKKVVLLVSDSFNERLNQVLNSGTEEACVVVPNPFKRHLFMERVYRTSESELRQRIAGLPRVSMWAMSHSNGAYKQFEGVGSHE